MSTFNYSIISGVGQIENQKMRDLQYDTTSGIMSSMGQLEKLVEEFLKEPPELSFDDVVSLLEAFGYVERKPGGGSHRVFVKSGTRPVIVPTIRGRKVKRVYIRRIIDILGLEEWYEEHGGT